MNIIGQDVYVNRYRKVQTSNAEKTIIAAVETVLLMGIVVATFVLFLGIGSAPKPPSAVTYTATEVSK